MFYWLHYDGEVSNVATPAPEPLDDKLRRIERNVGSFLEDVSSSLHGIQQSLSTGNQWEGGPPNVSLAKEIVDAIGGLGTDNIGSSLATIATSLSGVAATLNGVMASASTGHNTLLEKAYLETVQRKYLQVVAEKENLELRAVEDSTLAERLREVLKENKQSDGTVLQEIRDILESSN